MAVDPNNLTPDSPPRKRVALPCNTKYRPKAATDGSVSTLKAPSESLVALYLKKRDGLAGAKMLFNSPQEAHSLLEKSYNELVNRPLTDGKFGQFSFNPVLRKVVQYSVAIVADCSATPPVDPIPISGIKELMVLPQPISAEPSCSPEAEEYTREAEARLHVIAQWMHAQVQLRLEYIVFIKCCVNLRSGFNEVDTLAELLVFLEKLSVYVSFRRKECSFYQYTQATVWNPYVSLIPAHTRYLLASLEMIDEPQPKEARPVLFKRKPTQETKTTGEQPKPAGPRPGTIVMDESLRRAVSPRPLIPVDVRTMVFDDSSIFEEFKKGLVTNPPQ